MGAECTPVVLRLALPPGTAPEMVAAIVQEAVRAYLRQRDALDFPRKATHEERVAWLKGLVAEYTGAS